VTANMARVGATTTFSSDQIGRFTIAGSEKRTVELARTTDYERHERLIFEPRGR